jgi:hypothetical protein
LAPRPATLRATYTITIFWGALLLFAIQPMIGRMLLPRLGGTPSVWNTCMVFFQAVLLAGYAWAHGLARLVPGRGQVIVHGALAVGALLLLPFAIRGGAPAPDASPVAWLLATLVTAVGLPLVVVSTSAPLLQRWFAATRHPAAGDPYFLYAASNAGSLMALLAYPLLIEPWLGLDRQRLVWTAGYAVFAALTVACGALRLLGAAPRDVASAAEPPAAPTRRDAARWMVLAFVPSSLMLGVTQHVTTDVAAVPLFWVVPLAIYLLTYVLAFARRRIIRVEFLSVLMVPLTVTVLAISVSWPGFPVSVILALHLALLFVAALLCHERLADTRPPACHLTAFYLAVAAGGALGGVFNALVAPQVFDRVLEYPLIIAAAFLLRQRSALPWLRRRAATRFNVALDVVVVMLAIAYAPLSTAIRHGDHVLETDRTFFGVHLVAADDEGRWIAYYHGTTLHGLEDPTQPGVPLSYYHGATGLGRLYRALEGDPRLDRVAVVGLGVGTLGAYARPGQAYTFFEIDPAVVRIAADEPYFSFLRSMPDPPRIVLGDGRLCLAREPDGAFGLIILDAFSSDAIPVHLLTLEAIRLYASKLETGGLLVVNASNRHVDIERVIAGAARRLGLSVVRWTGPRDAGGTLEAGRFSTRWLIVGRGESALAPLLVDAAWEPLPASADDALWTDDYSNLLEVIWWW